MILYPPPDKYEKAVIYVSLLLQCCNLHDISFQPHFCRTAYIASFPKSLVKINQKLLLKFGFEANKQEQRILFKMTKGLLQRFDDGETLLVGEGYLFEFIRRGYLKSGALVPEVVIEHPELVQNMHEEFVHAGSEVVVAFTYYGHRYKMNVIGREDDVEKLNRNSLRMARKVANATDTLMAGDLSNIALFDPNNAEAIEMTQAMFKEQVIWAKEEGADYIIGETFNSFHEASLALEAIKQYGGGLPAVVTMAPTSKKTTLEGMPFGEACRKLKDMGAAVAGVNCSRGPRTMVPFLKEMRQACTGPIAALPVCYATTPEAPTIQILKDRNSGKFCFASNLAQHHCSMDEIEYFGQSCKEIGVKYIGLCCGNSSEYTRHLAEILGKSPPSLRYKEDMSKHFIFTGGKLSDYYETVKQAYLNPDD